MRKMLLAANWKMNKNHHEAHDFATGFCKNWTSDQVDVVIFPPFTALGTVATCLANTRIGWGAQTMHQAEKGAFTGEISAPMLKEWGCTYVLVGHSERRQYAGETDEIVCQKVRQAMAYGLIPLLCVGETNVQRQAGLAVEVVTEQVKHGLRDIQDGAEFVVAYEPIWAIGTGQVATGEHAQEMHAAIRETLGDVVGQKRAAQVRLLYGGSVTAENIVALLSNQDVDGALVGGASLNLDSFATLAHVASH